MSTKPTITIHTSFFPLAFITEEIFDDLNVVNLAGAIDVHEYRPTPQDIKALYASDLIIYDGDIETWSDLIVQLEDSIATLVATKNITKLEFGKKDKNHDEGEHNKHAKYDYDPHVWLDPILTKTLAKNIYNGVLKLNRLKEVYTSEKFKRYKTNYQRLLSRLDQLNEQYKDQLGSCKQTQVITSHNAYSYLAKRYGFTLLPIAGVSSLDTPSAHTLAKLKKIASENKIQYLLAENNGSKKFANTLAREANLEILVVTPLGRGTLDQNKDFFDVMQDNLHSLSTALKCN